MLNQLYELNLFFQKCIFLPAKINVLFCDIRLTFRYDLQAAALYDFRRMFERNAFIFLSRVRVVAVGNNFEFIKLLFK